MNEKDDFAKGILTGVLIGGLVGIVVGLLIAPKSGTETREELAGKAKDFAEKLQDEYDALYDKTMRTQDSLIHRLQEIEETARRKADELAVKFRS
jgi:gas vesicle protein